MTRAVLSLLLRLYPKPWRTRFGAEFEDLLATEPIGPSTFFDIARAATVERLFNTSGLGEIAMQTHPKSVWSLIGKPSGYLPIAMSLAAMALVVGVVTVYGAVREPDEGAAAHVFQLLVVAQLPILAFFATKWLAKDRAAALSVLAIQAVAVGLALLPVWAFGL